MKLENSGRYQMGTKNPYTIEKDENGNEWAVRNEAYWKNKALEKYHILLKRSGIPEFYWNIDWEWIQQV